MKKLIALFASAVLMLSMSATSVAGVITDTVYQSQGVDAYRWTNTSNSFHYTHNLNDNGFILGSAESGALSVAISNKDWYDVILFKVENFDFDTGGITIGNIFNTFSGDIEVNALAAINADGLLNVTIKSLWGSFTVGNSVLTVNTADVPEPGSILLLGLGLLGFGASRIRNAKL